MRVLVIEDDRETAQFLQRSLKESGHAADIAGDGETGLALAREGGYDVLIVDRMLPRLDGLSVDREAARRRRAHARAHPSALGEVDDRVKGLRAGGDDYLTKPYAYTELLARIEALARRPAPEEQVTRYTVGDLDARPPVAQGYARRRADPPAAARVPAARISDEAMPARS